MNKLIFQLIACAMLLCSIGLKAAEQTVASTTAEGYDSDLSAQTVDIILLHEQASDMETAQTAKAKHGQPLPGLMLSVLVGSAIMRALARMRRKAQHLQKMVTNVVAQGINKVVSLYFYITNFESSFVCCWEWQRTVLRL